MKESELIDIFAGKARRDLSLYPPLRLQTYGSEAGDGERPEGTPMVELRWGERKVNGALKAVGQATPRSIRLALEGVKEWGLVRDAEPVFLVPYLSEGIVKELERARVSGIDLNGNYLLLGADLVAVRLDQPNQYPSSRDIKKVYSFNSSIVGRLLLRQNRCYEQVTEIYDEIQRLGGGVSLSTVSKVLKSLEEELIIFKKRREIRLLQPARLLDRLRDGYREPQMGHRLQLKLPESQRTALLRDALGEEWLFSGPTSAFRYAATTTPSVWNVYSQSYAAMERLRKYEDRRFYNCIVEKCDDSFVYFDASVDTDGRWASPIETYLALAQLDKREREVAEGIRENIIQAEFDDA